MQIKKSRSIESRNSRNGFFFVLPWLIGVILFFIYPMLQSISFAFSNVDVTTSGFALDFVFLKNFRYAIYESPKYIENLVASLTEFAYQVPIITILSLIIAVVLNVKFPGRTFFRALFFIPVIFAGGIIDGIIGDSSSVVQQMAESSQSSYLDGAVNIKNLFVQMGLTQQVTSLIFGYIDKIFSLVWQCGVQIVLFISALQSIPEQLYEASNVEGASKWEEFWYITIPMLGNSMILVVAFTVIEFVVSSQNKVMSQAYTVLLNNQIYGTSSAMIWLYFMIIAVVVAVLFLIYNKTLMKKWY